MQPTDNISIVVENARYEVRQIIGEAVLPITDSLKMALKERRVEKLVPLTFNGKSAGKVKITLAADFVGCARLRAC